MGRFVLRFPMIFVFNCSPGTTFPQVRRRSLAFKFNGRKNQKKCQTGQQQAINNNKKTRPDRVPETKQIAENDQQNKKKAKKKQIHTRRFENRKPHHARALEGVERPPQLLVGPRSPSNGQVARREMQRVPPQRPPSGPGERLQEGEHLGGGDVNGMGHAATGVRRGMRGDTHTARIKAHNNTPNNGN